MQDITKKHYQVDFAHLSKEGFNLNFYKSSDQKYLYEIECKLLKIFMQEIMIVKVLENYIGIPRENVVLYIWGPIGFPPFQICYH